METFENLGLNAPLARGISELGFVKPSAIQAETLPILLGADTDFIGLAATGTGKTAAFAIPLLEKIDPEHRSVQALVLCPTRELCMQVTEQINLLGKYLGVRALPIYGGASYGDQFRGLRQGPQVIVGTPGRVIDHLERESLKIDEVSIVVLDEADEMISMGFREDMETILKKTSESERNIWLFSATMSPSVKKVADVFLKEAQSVQVNRGAAMLSATVEQIFFQTQEKNKPEVLCKLIDAAEDFFGLVFCQTKALVVDLQRYLSGKGYQVECLHGDMNQREREAAMLRFRERQAKILVCTDVAARGLDVKDVSHVVNYSLPRELDSYVHRIGRTARSGKAGKAFSLVTPSHRHLLGKIEKLTKSRFVEGEIPTRKAIALKKVAALHESFSTQTAFERAGKVLDSNWLASLEKMDKEEIAARFITLLMPDLFIERERDNQPEYSAPSYADAGRGREGREGRGGYGNRRHRDSGNRSQSYSNRERPQRNYSEQKYSEKGSVEQNFSGQPSTDQGERRPYRKSDKPAHAKRPFHSKPWDKPKRDAGSESPSRGSENTFKGGGFRKKKFRSQKPRQ